MVAEHGDVPRDAAGWDGYDMELCVVNGQGAAKARERTGKEVAAPAHGDIEDLDEFDGMFGEGELAWRGACGRWLACAVFGLENTAKGERETVGARNGAQRLRALRLGQGGVWRIMVISCVGHRRHWESSVPLTSSSLW